MRVRNEKEPESSSEPTTHIERDSPKCDKDFLVPKEEEEGHSLVCRRQKENSAQWEGTWLRGFARIVAAVDGGISLASFDGEGEEGGPTGRRDWHQEMMMMGGKKGGTKNCK